MFKCRDLLALPTMARSKLVAGKKGLDNGIRWSYKAENMNFAPWVHGRELLIVSTPIINSENFDLHLLIEEAIRLNLSGVLLLVGEEYISSISVKTLALADRNALPVISLPGEVPLVDIFEELGHAIVYEKTKRSEQDDLLAGVVFGGRIDASVLASQVQLLGYKIKDKQRIFMIHIAFCEEAYDQDIMTTLLEELEDCFEKSKCDVVISNFHCNLVGMTGEKSDEKLNEIFEIFYNKTVDKKNIVSCKIGVGTAYSDLAMLRKSFSEASTILKATNSINWYERIGFLKLLIETENQKQVVEYMEQILGNVIRHDEENNSELINTLTTYFECNENMKEVGNKIYIHPNTVKYRLQQIQEISGLSLAVTSEKVELYNALLIYRIMGIK